MHDDKLWLLHPVLPRPPALPKLEPELCALVGLDASDFEDADSIDLDSNDEDSRYLEARRASRRDTEPEVSASASGVHARAAVVRTGT